jgi:hypothetical protein
VSRPLPTAARNRAIEVPEFGATIRSVHASEDNPHKTGMFVRVIRRPRSRINSGTWWQVTDGRGGFWELQPDMCEVVPGAEVLRALAGVPTADVAAAQWCNCQAPSRLEGPWHPLGDMPFCPRPAAPEGVDAADEQDDPWYCPTCDELTRSCPHLPDGMDVEAQGEMADELTAAQAAIQRVRDLHRQHVLTAPDHDPYCEVCSYDDGWPCPTVRALDGDTTEEKR